VRLMTGLLTAVVLLLAGCGDPLETSTGSPAGEGTPNPVGSVSSLPSTGEIPAGFPVFEGAELISPVPAEPGLIARWLTNANGAAVYRFYADALPQSEFTVQELLPGGSAAVIRFTGADGIPLEVSLTADGAGTQVDLEVSTSVP
jgi:hypothetical protein